MTTPIRAQMEQTTNAVAGSVAGLTLAGISMPDIAAIAATLWICLQAGYWLYTKLKRTSPIPIKE